MQASQELVAGPGPAAVAVPAGQPGGAPVATIHLGDILQRVAVTSFEELRILLNSMKSWTPELRTVKLRNFISKAKKRLASLLALCKWLQINDVRKHFTCLNSITFEISNLESNLNEIQDGFFFTHRDLFAKRTRPINVKIARDSLSSSSYGFLSVPMFSCGLMPRPVLVSCSESDLKRNLNIFIKCKLALNDPMPMPGASSYAGYETITEEGLLTIKKGHMFEIKLSLQFADESAPWEIIDFRFLVQDSLRDSCSTVVAVDYDLGIYRQDVLFLLRSLTQSRKYVEDIFAATRRTISEVPDGQGAPEIYPSIESDEQAPLTMRRILKICKHASETVALRILYAQSLKLKQNVLGGDLLDVVYVEQEAATVLQLQFWKSLVSRLCLACLITWKLTRCCSDYRFRYSVHLLRNPVEPINCSEQSLTLSGQCLVVPPSFGESKQIFYTDFVHNGSPIVAAVIDAGKILTTSLLEDGVTFRCLLQQLMSSIGHLRICVLAARFLVTSSFRLAVNKVT
jgi:hypothetical protein